METKVIIIKNYADALLNAANSVNNCVMSMGDDYNVNKSIIRTINVLLESLRSETILTQGAIDDFSMGD